MINQTRIAKEAVRKLQYAKELHISAYIYGATGYGKTNTVAKVFSQTAALWISVAEPEETVLQQLHSAERGRYVVIDDLHGIDNETILEEILDMIRTRNFRMVLIGRTVPPSWMSQLILDSKMLVVTENDLRITEEELTALCDERGLHTSPERIRSLLNATEGNAMVLDLFLQQCGEDLNHSDTLERTVRDLFKTYLDEQIINHWNRDIQDFLMQMSVVDSFTLHMAEYITGDDSCSMLLSRAMKVGNILSCTEGSWQIRPVLRETLRDRALKAFGRRRYNQLLYNAARYYESVRDVLQALTLYEQCDEQDSIRMLLIREARNHPGVGHYWDLRRYYQALPDEEIAREPLLMASVSVLYSVLMNTEKSEYWYQRLKDYAERTGGVEHSEAVGELAYLDVALPHRGTRELIPTLKAIPRLIRNSGNVLRPVSLTNNQPSLMNGGKDFCEWSRSDIVLAATLGPLVEKILGKTGIGLSQTALGESAYEKGEDHYKVLSHLTRAQNQCENNGTIEMTWVGIGLQARLALCTGDPDYARRLANGMLRRAECTALPQLAESVKAFLCWLSLYENETSAILTWMTTAPDETVEFCTLNRYLYLVKIYCYLASGQHAPAMTLIQRMLEYADYADRHYLRIECELLQAIILRRTGDAWKEAFMQTLLQAADYGFTRIISEKGAAILPLLNDVKSAFAETAPKQAEWFEKVLRETTLMSRRYPNYLKGSGIDLSRFSDTALAVLRLQAAGCTTKEIADQLGITPRTVKYHAAENYKKLDAKNLVDAVQIAQLLHIL